MLHPSQSQRMLRVVVGTMLVLGCDSTNKSTTTPCGKTSSAELAACSSVERYVADLTTVAQSRPSGSTHWQTVQDLCASRLRELGYQVELDRYASGVNVVGQLGNPGGAHVLVSAHYDSVANCPGADDNATGVAALLEVARVLSTAKLSGALTVACWDEEERGMVGSAAYAQRAKLAGTPITLALAFEMLGYRSTESGSQQLPSGFELLFPNEAAKVKANNNRGDFIAVIADESADAYADAFGQQAATLGLPTVIAKVPSTMKNSSALNSLRRSDHASFWDVDYPAIMLTDTAEYRNAHYHCTSGPDATSDLDHGFTAQIVGATIGTIATMLGTR